MELIRDIQPGKPDNMHFFAELADLVYEVPSVIRPRLAKLGLGYDYEFEFFANPRKTAEGFALAAGDDIILCFRGTEGTKVRDWLTDLDFWQSQLPLGGEVYEVHGGFWEALSGVWGHMVQWLEAKDAGNKNIWICGHSLGGALASLALVRMVKKGWEGQVKGVYTYGCPRNVGQQLSERLNQTCKGKIFRFVNDEDIVPTVPPDFESIEPLDFSHFGTLVQFDADGDMHIGNIDRWNDKKNGIGRFASLLVQKVLDFADLAEKVTDHSMKNYKRLCKQHAPAG